MNLTDKHLSFEKYCKQLIGFKIIKVKYLELGYPFENPKPNYLTHFTDIHSVDFSVFFHTDKGKIVEICWDWQLHQYEIGVKIDKPSEFQGYFKWNLTKSDFWQKFISLVIVDVKLTWETISQTHETGRREFFTYPQDITLTFSNNKKIFISAAGFLNQNDKEVFGMLDNLTITDNEELARQVKMIA